MIRALFHRKMTTAIWFQIVLRSEVFVYKLANFGFHRFGLAFLAQLGVELISQSTSPKRSNLNLSICSELTLEIFKILVIQSQIHFCTKFFKFLGHNKTFHIFLDFECCFQLDHCNHFIFLMLKPGLLYGFCRTLHSKFNHDSSFFGLHELENSKLKLYF